MTRTENYQLPQWEASDPLRRGDFNEAMESIDAALTATYVIGAYTGDGKAMDDGGQKIGLEFRPRFMIISRGWISSSTPGPYFLAAGERRTTSLNNTFTIETDGFRVGTGDGSQYLNLNSADVIYGYIAFR